MGTAPFFYEKLMGNEMIFTQSNIKSGAIDRDSGAKREGIIGKYTKNMEF